jgi:hypothetical protein
MLQLLYQILYPAEALVNRLSESRQLHEYDVADRL